MNAVQVISDLWPVFLGLLATVAFIVGLSWQVKSIKERLDYVEKAQETLRTDHAILVQALGSIRESLARIEGRLLSDNEHHK